MAEKGLARQIGVGVSVAVVVAAVVALGGLLWKWGSGGGLIRTLGGVTAEDVTNIVQPLQRRIDVLNTQIAQIKKFAPYSFTATGCKVGHDDGVLFALHDSNLSPSPPSVFDLSGHKAAGLENHEWAQLHVCGW